MEEVMAQYCTFDYVWCAQHNIFAFDPDSI